MIGQWGGACQIAQQQFIIKTYKELILYKPVGKYQFTMACIMALAMIVYQVAKLSYFSTKTYVVGTDKNRRNETVLLSTKVAVKSDN